MTNTITYVDFSGCGCITWYSTTPMSNLDAKRILFSLGINATNIEVINEEE